MKTKSIKASDIKPGMSIKLYEFDDGKERRHEVTRVSGRLYIDTLQTDDNCPNGEVCCEDCGAGEHDSDGFDFDQMVEVFIPDAQD